MKMQQQAGKRGYGKWITVLILALVVAAFYVASFMVMQGG